MHLIVLKSYYPSYNLLVEFREDEQQIKEVYREVLVNRDVVFVSNQRVEFVI